MGMILPTVGDKMPQFYTNHSYTETVTQLNIILKDERRKLFFQLIILPQSLQFNYQNWKMSAVVARLQLVTPKQAQARIQQMQKIQPQIYEFVCTLLQIYKLYDLMKGLKRPDPLNQQTPTQLRQQKECDICYDQISDLVLPCGHTFGAQCISKYIIEKDQRLCPKCRREYPGRRSVIERDIYTVIEEDDQIFDQVRLMLFDTLEKGNEEIVKKVKQSLQKLNGNTN